MNIASLIKEYFSSRGEGLRIEMFDSENVYSVYEDIVKVLSSVPEIELSVLQMLGYCFYELLDNVLMHSGKKCGTTIMFYDESKRRIQILVADDGIGVKASLEENAAYKNISEAEALSLCVRDKVTDGKGMGFGLYSTMRLMQHAGILFSIHSGNSILRYDGTKETVSAASHWRGTVVFFEIKSDVVLDPNEIIKGRTDVVAEFNDTFLQDDELEKLW